MRGGALTRIERRVPASVASVAVTAVLLAAYLIWRPYSPDLSAQLARADVVKSAGYVFWWTGWFGGLSTPSYSVIVPAVMAAVGVRLTAVLAVVASVGAATRLTRNTLRPRLGAVTLSIASFADVLAGRVTFSVGFALALWALVCVREKRYAAAWVLTIVAFLATPLAALFLGIILVGLIISDPSRRTPAVWLAGVLVFLAGTAAILLPSPGQMPAAAWSMLPSAGGLLVVLFSRPPQVVRTVAWITLAALPFFVVLPLAVGSNIDRFVWMAATPAVAAVGRFPTRRIFTLALLATTIWPIADLAVQVRWPGNPSSTVAYYQPLVRELQHQQSALGPAAIGERLEVVDTIDHGASFELSRTFALARGWDRPADRANNPIFYQPGALTPDTYRQWLDRLAVGWIAVPSGSHDYAARAEAELLAQHVPYLKLTWSSADWSLFRVLNAQPLAEGASVISVGTSEVVLRTSAPSATVTLHVRYSPYLATVDPVTGDAVPSCVMPTDDGLTHLYIPTAGDVSVTSRFSIGARFRDTGSCLQKLNAPNAH